MRPYELIIDHESCWGCRTCEVACKQENHAPEGIRLIKVLEEGPRIIDGRLDFSFRVSSAGIVMNRPVWRFAPKRLSQRERRDCRTG